MSNANVVDELVVLLRLETGPFKRADAEVDKLVTRTERKLKNTDAARTKRMKESAAAAKAFGNSLRSLALTIGSVLGIGGGAAGLVGTVIALAGFETNLRRATVSTGLSNREMQAWGSTARRLGADAQAGAAAIADLAKEQKQFHLTGNAPTMQAFARMGVRVGPDMPVVDVLEQAQKTYRQSAPAQQAQIESGLTASGVSADLILLIKSEINVRDAYTRSLSEAATENRKAMDAVSDAMETVKNAAISVANTLATIAEPYVKTFADWVSKAGSALSAFNDRVIAAGGGVDGFMAVLDKESPELASMLRALGDGLRILGEAVDLAAYGVQIMAKGFEYLMKWIYSKLPAGMQAGLREAGGAIGQAVGLVGDAVKWAWDTGVPEARRQGANPVGNMIGDHGGAARLTPGAAARIAAGELGGGASVSATGARARGKGRTNAQEVMQYLITQHGFDVQQAAAIASSVQGESNFDPTAINPQSGAAGLYQLLSKDRVGAFVRRYGISPDKADWKTQLDFMATEPSERRRLNLSLAGANGAAALGERVSRIFEAHGNRAEDSRRALQAQQYANSYGAAGSAGPSVGQQINITGPVNVQANSPTELMNGITRVSGVTNYTTAVR